MNKTVEAKHACALHDREKVLKEKQSSGVVRIKIYHECYLLNEWQLQQIRDA